MILKSIEIEKKCLQKIPDSSFLGKKDLILSIGIHGKRYFHPTHRMAAKTEA